jgi:5'-methylthioadenosine phosphorylase
MTGQPEAGIARELALCYTAVAMVTDHDAGLAGEGAVTHVDALETFVANMERLRSLLYRTIQALPPTDPDATAACGCRRALDGLELPFKLP